MANSAWLGRFGKLYSSIGRALCTCVTAVPVPEIVQNCVSLASSPPLLRPRVTKEAE